MVFVLYNSALNKIWFFFSNFAFGGFWNKHLKLAIYKIPNQLYWNLSCSDSTIPTTTFFLNILIAFFLNGYKISCFTFQSSLFNSIIILLMMREYVQGKGEDVCHVIWCGASSISIKKVSIGVSPISLKKNRCSKHLRPMERRAGRRSSSLANLRIIKSRAK